MMPRRRTHVGMSLPRTASLERAGFRFGERGTQSSRHIMLRELDELLDALPVGADRLDYAVAIIDDNVLGHGRGARYVYVGLREAPDGD